mgnify:CR=1 FL=1
MSDVSIPMLRNVELLAAILVFASPARPASAAPGTVWLDFTAGSLLHGAPMTVATAAGTLVDVTVQTGGSQGLYSFNRDTLGAIATGLDYDSLYCLAIFNGGGTSSVSTTITFSNIRVGAGHERGYFLVGAVAGSSSPVTLTSSVPGRVATWTQVGGTFPFSPVESFAIDWSAPVGKFFTGAIAGNDSRGIVIDLGDLRTDGTITVSLLQYLNDGIYFALGDAYTLKMLPLEQPGARWDLAVGKTISDVDWSKRSLWSIHHHAQSNSLWLHADASNDEKMNLWRDRKSVV